MKTEKQLRKDLQKFLMASYAYYIKDYSLMTDSEYDHLSRGLMENWDKFNHQHKHLVTPGDLKAGTLFSLNKDNYPLMVIAAAESWIEAEESKGKAAGE